MGNIRLWLQQVSIKKNQDYIEKLLRKFNIEQYNFCQNKYGDYDLYFTYMDYNCKVTIDDFDMCLKLFRKNLSGNKKKKEYYHILKQFYGVDVWYDCLKWLNNIKDSSKSQNKIQNKSE